MLRLLPYNASTMAILDTRQIIKDAEDQRERRVAAAKKEIDNAIAEYEAKVSAVRLLEGYAPSVVTKKKQSANGHPVSRHVPPMNQMTLDVMPSLERGLTDVLRWAIRQNDFTSTFTTPDIKKLIENNGGVLGEKEKFMASAMVKLMKLGEIIRVQKGSGREPNIFRRAHVGAARMETAADMQNGQ